MNSSSKSPAASGGLALAVAGLVIGVVAIPIGIFVPEVRCGLHIDTCVDGKPVEEDPDGRGAGAKDLSTVFAEAEANGDLPYLTDSPASRQRAGEYAAASLDFDSVVNRGTAVVIPLSGSGFTTNACVQLEWFSPDGSTYLATCVEADDRGLVSTKLLWLPLRHLGIEGNDGAWKLILTDTSGQSVTEQLQVSSDDETPQPAEWETRSSLRSKATGKPDVGVGSSGSLCAEGGLSTETWGSGFTPDATAEVSYLRPDGKRVGARGVSINGDGELEAIHDYWTINDCADYREFGYTVVVIDEQGRRAEAAVGMPTSD